MPIPWKTLLVLAIILLALSLSLAWVSTGFQGITGWLSFLIALILAGGLAVGVWRLLQNENPPGWIATLLITAVAFRLFAGVLWYIVLPAWGHGNPAELQGYVMGDASARDRAAWKLARSENPLWTAFENKRKVDQYGGLLFLSALTYRYLGSSYHQPLLIVIFTAVFSSLAVLFTWAFARRAWGTAAAALAALFLTLYPEAVLLGSSQMREAFTITLTAAAFYGLLLYQHERTWISLAWILIPLLLFLPFSPPFAALLVGLLAVTAFASTGNLARDVINQRVFWMILGAMTIIVLIGLWLALRQFTPEGMANPIAMLSWWLRKSASLQAFRNLGDSGIIQMIFDRTPEWMHLPLSLIYGVVQPFLPAAAAVGSHAPIWRWINLWRAVGWTLVLVALVYAPMRVFGPKGNGSFTKVLILVIWIVMLVAAYRGGSDQWDTPRYRAVFAALQVALAAWIVLEQWRSPDPWLRRTLLGIFAVLIWFFPWYLYRKYSFPWPVTDFFLTLTLGIVSASLLVVWDWLRTKKLTGKDGGQTNLT